MTAKTVGAVKTGRKIKITGTGEASGGMFDSIAIMGEAKLYGDIETARFKCMGQCQITGEVHSDRFRLQGEVDVGGNLSATKLTTLGQAHVKGHLQGEEIVIRGMLQAGGGCEAETIQITGGIQLGGLLNAEKITIQLYGPSKVREIGGGQVQVRRSRWKEIAGLFMSRETSELTADIIEGDEVYVEYTNAKLVRGNRVILGPGCRIETVQYRESLRKNKSAKVRHEYSI